MRHDPITIFVTIQDAANLLGVSADTLRRWDAEGRFLPDRRTAGGWRLYSRERLLRERFMEDVKIRLAKTDNIHNSA